MDCGIILFAHGSRDPLWHRPMEAVAARIRQNDPQATVVCAYLELTEPTLIAAAQQLITGGARTVTIVPMFLGVGRHVREDLPLLVAELEAAHPNVVFSLKQAVGEDEQMIALMAKIALS